MSGRAPRDPTGDEALRIIAGSRSAALAGAIVDAAARSMRGARSLAAGRRLAAAARMLPASERGICAALLVAAAIGGHLVMASMLPLRAQPTAWLTAGVLLAASLAAVAASARSR